MRDEKYFESRCFHTGVVSELINQLKHPIMLRVMYKNAQLPIILAIMARRRDLSDFEKEGSQMSIGGLKGVCVCQSPDLNPTEHLWEILELRLRQCFPPLSTKHQITEWLMEEWCHIPPIDTCRSYS